MNSRIMQLILCVATLATNGATAQSPAPAALPAPETSAADDPQIAPSAANATSRPGRSRYGEARTRSSMAGTMPGGGGYGGSGGSYTVWAPARSAELAKFPLIHFSQPDTKTLDALTEDLNVMSLLLEQTVERVAGENSHAYKMGIPMLLNSGVRGVQAAYIEGFGVLFTASVNFPLVPPPPAKEKESETRTGSDDWQKARQQILGHPEAPDTYNPLMTGAVPYDAEQTAAFRKVLLQALKHAVNIRTLKSDEVIVVTVFGADNVATMRNEVALKEVPAAAYGVNPTGYVTAIAPLTGRDTVLSIRVRKSDAEAFAGGKLSFDQFEQKATISSYLGAAKTGGALRGAFYPAGATAGPLAPSVR